jgi:hypothetical protein
MYTKPQQGCIAVIEGQLREPATQHERSAGSPDEVRRIGRRRSSFILRHWRGELELGPSYWLCGILGSVLAGVLDAVIGAVDITQAPRIISFCLGAMTPVTLLVSVWQAVGIWRSASRRAAERHEAGKRAVWAGLAKAAMVLGSLSIVANVLVYRLPNMTANFQIAFGHDPTPHHKLRLLNGGRVIELSGGFDFGTSVDLTTLLDATREVRTVELNSTGGRVAEAKHVRDLIRAHHLATYTSSGCASACTLAYVGGNPRFIASGAKLAFHRYSFPGMTPQQDMELNRQGEQELTAAGVSPEFAHKAFTTPPESMWAPDLATLLSAHVVTQQLDGYAATITGLSADDVMRELDTVPSYAALKENDPVSYARVQQIIADGIRDGKELRELIAQAQAPLLETLARYRSIADDQVQADLAALIADEARTLASDHPDACIALLMGGHASEPSYYKFLPKEMQQRDTAVTGAIISSGAKHPSYAVAQDSAAEIGVLWRSVATAGFDISVVGQEPRNAAQQRSLCRAMAEFFRQVAFLPQNQLGPLMRYLHRS